MPRGRDLTVSVNGHEVTARDDFYSDRIRCDHPPVDDGAALGAALLAEARSRHRGRIVVLAPGELRDGLIATGSEVEAVMPGFYRNGRDCAVLGLALDPVRRTLSDPEAVTAVDRLLSRRSPGKTRPHVETQRATNDDAPAIAELIAETFEHYPTPSGVPQYIADQITDGVPFRLIREENEIIACASAGLVRDAQTAELTDCATRPAARGRGLMQSILTDLMDDLREMGYPTAFTLARAREPGMNLAFQRLGFAFRGRMIQSCRIGTGFEDMNVWSRRL
jgi:putative beta-lysine N-acetyltransferase